jgi:hypothetical protein
MQNVNEIWKGVSVTKQKFQDKVGNKNAEISEEEYLNVLNLIVRSRASEPFRKEAKKRFDSFSTPIKVEVIPEPIDSKTDDFQKVFNVISLLVIVASCIVYTQHSSVVYNMLISNDFGIESGSFMGYVFGAMIEISVFSASLIYAHAVKSEDRKTQYSAEDILLKFAWGHFVISLIYFQVFDGVSEGITFEIAAFVAAKVAFSSFLSYAPYTIKNLIKL